MSVLSRSGRAAVFPLVPLVVFLGVVLTASTVVPASKAGRTRTRSPRTSSSRAPARRSRWLASRRARARSTTRAASNLVLGSAGVDTIRGMDGNDCILGGAGNDSLRGDGGTDVCIGGAGNRHVPLSLRDSRSQ